MKKLICLFMSLVMLTLVACNRQDKPVTAGSSGAAVNKAATDIAITSLSGTQHKLSDFKGKVVMLNFWATWCPPCREEVPSLMRLNKLMEGKPFQMLAVSLDEGGKPDVERFFRVTGYSLPVYTDQDRKSAGIYGVTGVPETFIIDQKGIIVKKVIGPLKWDDPEIVAFITKLMK